MAVDRGMTAPNVVLVYADDLGYGDVKCCNPASKIPTPNLDRLAAQGVVFADAHTPAAICGPSRYGLLTGRYPWRNDRGIELGHAYDQCKIEEGRLTLAAMLGGIGYHCAEMGKWGLRYDYRSALRDPATPLDEIGPESFDYSRPILGPNIRGFDYSLTAVMFAIPDPQNPARTIKSKWMMENGRAADGEDVDPANFDWYAFLPRITERAVEYIEAQAGSRDEPAFGIERQQPFFLYFDPHVPHLPLVPNAPFRGTSEAGEYGDYVVELDDSIGRLMQALEDNGLAENTIFMVSSDNGPESVCYEQIRTYGHYSMGDLRGVKRDNWEGGSRVPFLVRWPGLAPAGTRNETPIGLIGMMATLAEYFGIELDSESGVDSHSFLAQMRNPEQVCPEMPPVVYHTPKGDLALRWNGWVYIDAPSGMCSHEPEWFREERGVQAHTQAVELFDLREDPQQLVNVAARCPDQVRAMEAELERISASSGSRFLT
jgi:arylsulfatase A